jgi:hypothetical protein
LRLQCVLGVDVGERGLGWDLHFGRVSVLWYQRLLVIFCSMLKKLSRKCVTTTKDRDTSRAEQIAAVHQYLHAPPNPTSKECHFIGSTMRFRPPPSATTASQRCLTSLTNHDCLREEGKQARDPALYLFLDHGFFRHVLHRQSDLHSAPVARNILRTGLIAFGTRSLSTYHRSEPGHFYKSRPGVEKVCPTTWDLVV